ncbi:hypothetical protein J6590_057310 [Homalodisca vitripennis]|nr:hypothetical protein J6590_057310 [Homalodisca vitripennis]
MLSRGFKTLNDLVKACWFRVKHPSTEDSKTALQEISEIHFFLTEAVRDTCSFFELPLLSIFTLYFLNLVINSHRIIQEVADSNRSYLTLSARICWFCFSFVKFVLTAWVCNQLTYHAKKTSFYLSCHLSLDLPPVSRDMMAGMAMTYLMVMVQLENF